MTLKWHWVLYTFLLYFLDCALQAPARADVQETSHQQHGDNHLALTTLDICLITFLIIVGLLALIFGILLCSKKSSDSEGIALIKEHRDATSYGLDQHATGREEYRRKEEELKRREDEIRKKEDEIRKKEDEIRKKEDEIRKKEELIKMLFRLEAVHFDPVTAHPKLLLTDNTVKHVDQWKDVPDNPLRFDSHLYVLGSERFHSGNHYWIVEVGDKTEWDLGIASDSVNRKGSITLSPANGFWVIGLCNETDYWARASSVKKLKITDKPRMIGIFLQYDQKQVSFYNDESLSHLYSFSNCEFGQDLKPFFSPGTSSNGMNSMALKVIQKYFH